MTDYPTFRIGEIAQICYVTSGRRPIPPLSQVGPIPLPLGCIRQWKRNTWYLLLRERFQCRLGHGGAMNDVRERFRSEVFGT